jgi:hypothetical protein
MPSRDAPAGPGTARSAGRSGDARIPPDSSGRAASGVAAIAEQAESGHHQVGRFRDHRNREHAWAARRSAGPAGHVDRAPLVEEDTPVRQCDGHHAASAAATPTEINREFVAYKKGAAV